VITYNIVDIAVKGNKNLFNQSINHRGPVPAAGIKSQKLKYANALAGLPKQVLRDILDSLDACNESDEPFDCLKDALLGQFRKRKWQSYFELLRLPVEMQGLKPSVLMGKL
jgi:hypothetical protein